MFVQVIISRKKSPSVRDVETNGMLRQCCVFCWGELLMLYQETSRT